MTTLTIKEYVLPGAPLGPENPLPNFRSPDPHRSMVFRAEVPAEKRQLAGWEAGYRVLPYRMQDEYSRKRQVMAFKSIVLENEHLRATFLPQLGGRLVSLVHLPEGRELLSCNPVFQPANLALRNAWFSGGIEWNIGHYGHTFFTCSPVFAAEVRGLQGEPGLRLFEYERCKGLFWQVDFFLPPNSEELIAATRISNCSPRDTPFYWWTNTAVPEAAGTRVLSPRSKVIYIDFNSETPAFGYGDLPHLSSLAGDASYSTNFTHSSEYFFQLDDISMPWEAALDEHGSGFFEASTDRLRYRKMFCWGTHTGGRRWQTFLSEPGTAYLEIQAGVAPTQGHGCVIPGGAIWSWAQVFGELHADPRRVHQPDYQAAITYVNGTLGERFPAGALEALRARYLVLADQPVVGFLQQASGWGALELVRRSQDPQALPVPAGYAFPAESLKAEQQKWLDLLEKNVFPDPDPAHLPGEWMIQPEWLARLAALPHKTWFSLLHEGVARMEQFDAAGAEQAWQQSLALKPSVWAYRNLAVAAQRRDDTAQAREYYDQAIALGLQTNCLPLSLAIEGLQNRVAAARFEEAGSLLAALPAEFLTSDRLQILAARIHLELGELDQVEPIFSRELSVIQEGETELTDIWADLWLKREAGDSHAPIDPARREEILKKYPPPAAIDFRMR